MVPVEISVSKRFPKGGKKKVKECNATSTTAKGKDGVTEELQYALPLTEGESYPLELIITEPLPGSGETTQVSTGEEVFMPNPDVWAAYMMKQYEGYQDFD